MLETALHALIDVYAKRRAVNVQDIQVSAPDAWQVDVSFHLPDGAFRLRNLGSEDAEALTAFSRGLGDTARELFCPYPWDDSAACTLAFQAAVAQSTGRIDASYLLEHDGEPFAHFFLWKAGGNPVSQQAGLEVPELGVAIADAYQGRGFGSLAVRTLKAVARQLDADAIELTTATNNDAGWHTYQRAGFHDVGLLRVPLGVDVTAAELGDVTPTRFRVERQMVDILHQGKRHDILQYLAVKRGEDWEG
ncbi:MAG TPA: GNAT family N-acetyltransferase [Armatimonadota bacterium]